MSAAVLQTHPDPHKWTSLALALAVHGVLAVFLFFGVRWNNPMPAVVEVELVSARPAAVAEPPPPPRAAPRPPPPKAEPVALPKPDIALKDRDKPKPPPKLPPKLPPKAVPVPLPPPEKPLSKAERERAQQQLQERQADALAREMQQLENKKLNQQLERELARSQADANAAREAAARAAAEAAAQATRGRLIAQYQDRIRGKIRGNIVRPLDLRGNPVARFDVTQLPSGEILDVVMTASSGQRAWDEAVERAIRKSSPLPRAESSELHQRLLHLIFCPDEERGCR